MAVTFMAKCKLVKGYLISLFLLGDASYCLFFEVIWIDYN